MHSNQWVGASSVRVATLALFFLLGIEMLFSDYGPFRLIGRVPILNLVCTGLLAWIGAVYSFSVTHDLWLKFSHRVGDGVTTLLFAVLYLAVIPPFFLLVWAYDPLRLRHRTTGRSFWIARRPAPSDIRSFRRMG